MTRPALRALGSVLVALVLLLPRATHAEVVEDADRMGEFEDDGMRFGGIVVKGELVASVNAPGGWTLVRTYQNKTDERQRVEVDERVLRMESVYGARVTDAPTIAVLRRQVLDLAPGQKKAIGTYLPTAVAADMERSHRIEQGVQVALAAGHYEAAMGRSYATFSVDYLRPLPPGATAAPLLARGSVL